MYRFNKMIMILACVIMLAITLGTAQPALAASSNVAVTGVTLDQPSLQLTENGASATLVATINPANATNKKLTWRSSYPWIASVVNGVVTPKSAGKTTIKVSTYNGKTATCKVEVIKAYVPVQLVQVFPYVKSLYVGESFTPRAIVLPLNATDKKVIWSSNAEKIASVDINSGKVTANGIGDAVITATINGLTAACRVSVKSVPVTGVTLNNTTITFDGPGSTFQLIASILPANATNRNVVWSSDNWATATVDQTGLVTSKNAGTANIVAKTLDGGKIATCRVIVKTNVQLFVGSLVCKINGSDCFLDEMPRLAYEPGDPSLPPPPVMVIDRIAWELGATPTWDAATQTVAYSYSDKSVVMTIGSKTAIINGVEVVMNAPPFIENGRIFVPIRYVAEGLGYTTNEDISGIYIY
ncbi:MAG: Ig-like domain-containing protein [Ignavibacteriales bacterium]